MKRDCHFRIIPAFAAGLALLWAAVLAQTILEVHDPLTHLLGGAGAGLAFVGLLYGSPKTRPLFDRFRAFKLRLLGRENAN